MKFGLIGCGRVAPRHAQSIQEIADAELAAVADVVEARAAHFAKTYGGDYYLDYHHLLERPDIDIVNIATPSGMHARMAVDALEAGKHVILEKPMALTVADATWIIETAERTGQKLCIVLQNRFNPPMQDLKHLLDYGQIGQVYLGSVTVRWYRPQEYYEDGWHGTKSMDGGALMNQAIHHIDALQWLMGEPVEVSAYTATLAHRMEAEDVGVANIRFRNGGLGVVEGSTITYPENLEGSVALFGQEGSVKVGGTALNRKVFWKVKGQLEHERELLTREAVDPPSVYGSSHKSVILDMMEAVRTNRLPKTHGKEGRKSVALVLAMYQSSETGQPVKLDHSLWNS